MNCRLSVMGVLFSAVLAGTGLAAPVIDPIANVTIPAGKSLILPITATSASGRALTYTITSSTNAIAVVMHTNNPFWQLTVAQAAATNAPGAYNTPYRGGLVSVTNVGTMTFMLFPEYASHTINVFQGLTESGFYNSNTIFHRVISGFMIQGGDPETNGAGGLVFQYNDEFNPQAIFSGNGQLALANSGKNTDGSQFFVTIAPYRSGDFTYTIFGQLVRGFPILTNLNSTAVDTSSRPLADEIIQTAAYVTNTADTVLTLTATNVSGAAGTITVIADDGAGGRATNTFKAATATDTNSNNNAFINTQILATNLVAPVNMTLTNLFSATELDGETLYWYLFLAEGTPANSISNGPFYPSNSILRNLTYNLTNANGLIQFLLEPYSNYSGTVSVYFDVSSVNTNIYDLANWSLYQHYGYTMPPFDEQLYTFVFGDTPILGQSNTVTALPAMPFTNLVLATFTNGVAGSIYTNFTASINWGDNSTNVGTLTANAAGRKAVLGSHTYSYPGSYPVYVAVQSGIGASTTILSIVNVTNPPTPVTNSLTVQASGQGTVAYSNTPLAVGDSYSVGATAANLWFLLNWTDNNGFVLGTGTNLTFTMSPGLSLNANFALIANPTVTIASPTNSQVVTNLYSSLATITGTASNNATVASVWCQVNSGGWWQAVGTTNWSFSFTPTYSASNFVQAYSVNNYGYVSTTNTMLVKYLAGGVLTLTTNGLGSIAPNLNGDLLPFGTNYTLTATPASGFSFVNWTGSFSTNKATLSFTMTNSPSLTATFADATAPTIAITNLASGQQVTTNVFGALGTASDNNWLVANVFYSLNGAAWTNATTTNTWTNWTAVLTLMAGTNTIAAYAVDPNGKPSLTNAFSFQYLVTNQLVIRSVGLGTILPNYSNSWLQIGHNYSMVATPATGFAFTNWTISTNWLGGAVTNNATVQFMMASNLTLQVTFADVTKPAVNITNLVAGQRVTNTAFTLMGTASDNVQVSNVQVQLNGVWTNATTANVWTNWSAVLNLNPGTNTVAAFAADTSGNPSITNQLTFDSVVTNLLGVRAVGLGTIAPNDSNAWLEVGRNYTIVATPATGFVVTNWIISTNWLGGAVTNNATVQFMMASNLTVQVTFAETNKPTLTITWPTSGQHMTNALPTVIGTVSDDWGVAGVWYQLNGGAWTAPFTTNVWTNWSATVQLGAGSNMVSAYALNLGGNYSATNSVSVLSSNAFLLKLGFLTATPSATNGLNFGLLVSTGLTGHIQFSTNLLSWATLTNFSGSNSPLHLLDPAATNSSARYYRAVIP